LLALVWRRTVRQSVEGGSVLVGAALADGDFDLVAGAAKVRDLAGLALAGLAGVWAAVVGAAGLADVAAGLAVAGLADGLLSGLGLGLAVAGLTARVSWIAEVTAVVPAADPAWPVPAAAAAGGDVVALGTGSAHGMLAGAAPVRWALGKSMVRMLTATTDTPANTLAAGAPAVRILTSRASRAHQPRLCRAGPG
jgi:hypothetical protein